MHQETVRLREAGVPTIFQKLNIVLQRLGEEDFLLGQGRMHHGSLDHRSKREQLPVALPDLAHEGIDLRLPVRDPLMDQRQFVERARVLVTPNQVVARAVDQRCSPMEYELEKPIFFLKKLRPRLLAVAVCLTLPRKEVFETTGLWVLGRRSFSVGLSLNPVIKSPVKTATLKPTAAPHGRTVTPSAPCQKTVKLKKSPRISPRSTLRYSTYLDIVVGDDCDLDCRRRQRTTGLAHLSHQKTDVFLIDKPTHSIGVDIKADIYRLIAESAYLEDRFFSFYFLKLLFKSGSHGLTHHGKLRVLRAVDK